MTGMHRKITDILLYTCTFGVVNTHLKQARATKGWRLKVRLRSTKQPRLTRQRRLPVLSWALHLHNIFCLISLSFCAIGQCLQCLVAHLFLLLTGLASHTITSRPLQYLAVLLLKVRRQCAIAWSGADMHMAMAWLIVAGVADQANSACTP